MWIVIRWNYAPLDIWGTFASEGDAVNFADHEAVNRGYPRAFYSVHKLTEVF